MFAITTGVNTVFKGNIVIDCDNNGSSNELFYFKNDNKVHEILRSKAFVICMGNSMDEI